ncbi:YkgJ family cysteine cluster protein [Palaeococcus ferrophilus]|uniref:YkgJ family cysteine cluster protein n=1 Tax=Palaeococcus ferrophilus TaxID=83868 RepID=UPI00064E96F8|nr:YkgJ family cysteine cluster protein [Palaeococcus ferrophilus]
MRDAKSLVATIYLDTGRVEFDPNFKFKCLDDCAKCCVELDIPLRDEDITRIEELGYSTWEFVDYEKMFYRGDRFVGYALKKRPFDGACPFLREDGKCAIYPHRPLACRLYPFLLVKHGNVLEIYVRNVECPGIGHEEGRPVDEAFIEEYFGEVVEEYRGKMKSHGAMVGQRA